MQCSVGKFLAHNKSYRAVKVQAEQNVYARAKVLKSREIERNALNVFNFLCSKKRIFNSNMSFVSFESVFVFGIYIHTEMNQWDLPFLLLLEGVQYFCPLMKDTSVTISDGDLLLKTKASAIYHIRCLDVSL